MRIKTAANPQMEQAESVEQNIAAGQGMQKLAQAEIWQTQEVGVRFG